MRLQPLYAVAFTVTESDYTVVSLQELNKSKAKHMRYLFWFAIQLRVKKIQATSISVRSSARDSRLLYLYAGVEDGEWFCVHQQDGPRHGVRALLKSSGAIKAGHEEGRL